MRSCLWMDSPDGTVTRAPVARFAVQAAQPVCRHCRGLQPLATGRTRPRRAPGAI